MSDRFDVFDAAGNKIGEFTPSDSESEGLAGLVAILIPIVLIACYPLYILGRALVRLVTWGVEAARKGDWATALLCWVIIPIPIALVYWLIYWLAGL